MSKQSKLNFLNLLSVFTDQLEASINEFLSLVEPIEPTIKELSLSFAEERKKISEELEKPIKEYERKKKVKKVYEFLTAKKTLLTFLMFGIGIITIQYLRHFNYNDICSPFAAIMQKSSSL